MKLKNILTNIRTKMKKKLGFSPLVTTMKKSSFFSSFLFNNNNNKKKQ
jgi:hypothetical protein